MNTKQPPLSTVRHRITLLAALAAIALLLAALPREAAAQQPPPHRFFGSVTINGQPAPVGSTVIVATADSPNLVISVVETAGQYQIDVPDAGLDIQFLVNGVDTGVRATTVQGQITQLDLVLEPTDVTPPDIESPLQSFSGNAYVDGRNAPLGAIITAVGNGQVIHRALVNTQGQYNLRIPGDAIPGTQVTFAINGLIAAETAVLQSGGNVNLNLSANSQGLPPQPAPTSAPRPQPTATQAPAPTTGAQTEATQAPAPTAAPQPTVPPLHTSTPLPTPTPEPTSTPPPSLQGAFRVGPTVRLRPVNDVIDSGKDGLVEILFRNPVVNDTNMIVDLTVSLPSGIHVSGEGFATSAAAGAASATFTVVPGQSQTIYLNVKSEKVGQFTIHFSGLYWPQGNKDLFNPISLTHPFTVNEPSPNPASSVPTDPNQIAAAQTAAPAAPQATAAPPPSQYSDPSASCGLSPDGSAASGAGDMALLALPLVGLAGLAGLRRRRLGS